MESEDKSRLVHTAESGEGHVSLIRGLHHPGTGMWATGSQEAGLCELGPEVCSMGTLPSEVVGRLPAVTLVRREVMTFWSQVPCGAVPGPFWKMSRPRRPL